MYTRYGGFLQDISKFDAQFFGISPREAVRMDPQQRLLAEVTWEALENAGLAVDKLAGSQTGVFIGLMNKNEYAQLQIKLGDFSCVDDPYFGLGSSGSIVSGRLSYLFDLHGPGMTVDTGCSSSLVCVHLACQSLRNRECDLALVGGVNTILLPENIVNDCKMRMLSADGRCKTFDATADGYVPSEGCGVVVLKRLSEAIASRNNILALIRGTAINQDGRSKGITAPNKLAQEALICQALANAGLEAHQLGYVEAHGSGTSLGDCTEVEALSAALGKGRSSDKRLVIGTVKTSIGHLTGAAGITGMIKTVLVLQYKEIPPHLHLTELNPHIPWQESPIVIPTKPTPWSSENGPRIAGVSSFGWSGTNAHVVLEEAPVVEASSASRPWQLLVLSAKTDTALEMTTDNLVTYLKQHPFENLADIVYTYQIGRSALSHRRILVCCNIEDAVTRLEKGDPLRVLTGTHQITRRPIIFLLPGLGDHYVNMAQQLYETEPMFRECVDHCSELLKHHLGLDLRDVIYHYKDRDCKNAQTSSPPSIFQQEIDLRSMLHRGGEQTNERAQKLYQTVFAQPALFVVDYALAQLWLSWGIHPEAMIGYSLGEYVAACLAGVISLQDALMLVAKRAQMIQELPRGAMLAVALSEEETRSLLGKELSLAAINGAAMSVVAGPTDAVDGLESYLAEREVVCSRLQTSHAFHSTMMKPIEKSLIELVKTINLSPPQIPYVSNVTGTWIAAEQATDPTYWARHLCQTIRFADGLQELWQKPGAILLEVGPGQILGSLALQHSASKSVTNKVVLPSLRHGYDKRTDWEVLLRTIGQLWLAGVQIDWSGFYAHEQRRILTLPTYPFERQHYWVEETGKQSQSVQPSHAAEKKLPDISHWFYVPVWKQSRPFLVSEVCNLSECRQRWLIFADACGVGKQIVEHLKQQNLDVTVVQVDHAFCRIREGVYTINPRIRDDYDALLKHLQLLNKTPHHIVHLWNVTRDDDTPSKLDSLETSQHLGFYSLLFLAQALGNLREASPIRLSVLASSMHDVLGGESLCPEKATILGPCKVIPDEYPNITCRCIDILTPEPGTLQAERLAGQLMTELSADVSSKELVAYRGDRRWMQSVEPVQLEDTPMGKTPFRQKGVYLITGGLGGLGLALAEYLAKTVQARLILVSRSALPERERWTQWLSEHNDQDQVSRKISKIKALEDLGAEVLLAKADVSNLEQMQLVIANARQRFGQLHGVIHTAGIPGEGLIQLKTPEMTVNVLAPKLRGTLVLDTVLKEENLDFMIFYSSINAITGGLGEVDYCAANAFLDAFAHYRFSRCATPTVSINWNLWKWDAWQGSLFASLPEVHAHIRQIREQCGITFQEGESALHRILSNPQPQILVLPQGFDKSVEQAATLSSLSFLEDIDEVRSVKTVYARPDLRTPYVAPRSEAEQKIAAIWQELLGIEKVGIHDHFFELGGNSLIGMLAISRLKKAFGIELSAANLFEGPTISSLLELIPPNHSHQDKVILEQSSARGKLRRERLRKQKQSVEVIEREVDHG